MLHKVAGQTSEASSRGTAFPHGGRLLSLALSLALVVDGLFAAYLAVFHLNVLQVDAAGHIASARALRDGYFHFFHDGLFLGYVQNLFYPPLEDVVIAALGWFTGDDLLVAYKVYLVLLIGGYVGALIYLAGVFRRDVARVFFLVCALALLHLDKALELPFQGLSLVDILVTGLTAGALGFVFLLLLIRELVVGRQSPRLAVYSALAVLSHLVAGPVAVFLMLVYAVFGKSWYLVRSVAISLALSAFFLVPLMAYKEQVFASHILREPPYLVMGLLLVAVLMLRGSRRAFPLPLAGFCFLLPEAFDHLTPLVQRAIDEGLVPAYHYYRLEVFALFFLMMGLGLLLDQPGGAGRRRSMSRMAAVLTVLYLVLWLDLRLLKPGSREVRAAEVPDIRLPVGETFKRVFAVHHDRPCDFFIDSLSVAQGQGTRFNKGLYWESSRNNQLLSSYLATVLGASDLVLDYWYYTALSCPQVACFMDHFARDYNIGWILMSDPADVEYFTPDKQKCWEFMLRIGTPSFGLQADSDLTLDGKRYILYRLLPRPRALSHGVVELLSWEDVEGVDTREKWYYSAVMRANMEACQNRSTHRQAFVHDEDFEALQGHVTSEELGPPPPSATPSLRSIGKGDYEIDLGTSEPVLFRVKFNRFPGFELRDADGELLPLYEGISSMIAVGSGTVHLRYRRTRLMKFSYGLSSLALAAFALSIWTTGRVRPTDPPRRDGEED